MLLALSIPVVTLLLHSVTLIQDHQVNKFVDIAAIIIICAQDTIYNGNAQ